jgi:hypothetical protein
MIERAVKSPAYVLAARTALKLLVWTPPKDDHEALLKAAEEVMMKEEVLTATMV